MVNDGLDTEPHTPNAYTETLLVFENVVLII